MANTLCRKAVVALVAALFSFAGTHSSHASSFDFDQFLGVSDPFFFGSQNVIFYYDTGETIVTPYQVGDYSFYYSLPFGADIGFFHYSYQDGQYVEAVYLNDYAI